MLPRSTDHQPTGQPFVMDPSRQQMPATSAFMGAPAPARYLPSQTMPAGAPLQHPGHQPAAPGGPLMVSMPHNPKAEPNMPPPPESFSEFQQGPSSSDRMEGVPANGAPSSTTPAADSMMHFFESEDASAEQGGDPGTSLLSVGTLLLPVLDVSPSSDGTRAVLP